MYIFNILCVFIWNTRSRITETSRFLLTNTIHPFHYRICILESSNDRNVSMDPKESSEQTMAIIALDESKTAQFKMSNFHKF